MREIPLMSKASDPLSGVNMTLKSVAEKDELSIHVCSELDSNLRMAAAKLRLNERRASSVAKGDVISERCMV